MPCFYPRDAWRARKPNKSGKYSLVFNADYGQPGSYQQVPCQQCIGCRLEYSRQWAMRCVHEASLHSQNCFITLTYDPEKLPYGGTLVPKHFTDFMKRLRYHLGGKKIGYFMCGEYGENFERPHYHACLFRHCFTDLKLYSSRGVAPVYTSQFLEDRWENGFCTVGELNFETAAYTARYITKKITGELAEDHYSRIDPVTGEWIWRHPEFCRMSRNPGIASEWYQKYKSDLNKDFITMRGVKVKPPKFYDRKLEEEDPEKLERKKVKRRAAIEKHEDDNTPERLAVKKNVLETKIKRLQRKLEK